MSQNNTANLIASLEAAGFTRCTNSNGRLLNQWAKNNARVRVSPAFGHSELSADREFGGDHWEVRFSENTPVSVIVCAASAAAAS